MRLIDLGKKVKRQYISPLKLITKNATVTGASNKINDQIMRGLADQLKAELPGCGFALITFDTVDNETCANYVSNLTDDFMIKALEMQLETLRKSKESSANQLLSSGS